MKFSKLFAILYSTIFCLSASSEAQNSDMFEVSLPIKKVEITDRNRIITVSGIYKGVKVGFILKIPLNAEARLKKVATKNGNFEFEPRTGKSQIFENEDFIYHTTTVFPEHDAIFISTGTETLNFFNMLGLGKFREIKPIVRFIFNNLVGNMEDINKNCESAEDEVNLKYSSSITGHVMEDKDIRIKIVTYYDGNKELEFIGDNERELALLIDISPSKKRIYLMEKDTSNRSNLRYIFSKQNLWEKLLNRIAQIRFVFNNRPPKKNLAPYEIYAKMNNLSKEEVEQILEEAALGNAEFQLIAGIIYSSGISVESDISKAIEWWEKSAKSGNTTAQRYLGVEYWSGERVPQNYKKAFEYYKQAADSGDASSMCNVGLMYELGQYIEKDLSKAVEYFQKAADIGSSFGQILLADMYYDGLGVSMDVKNACKLYKQALSGNIAQTDIPRICGMLGRIYAEFETESGLSKEEGIGFAKKAFELGETHAITLFGINKNLYDKENAKWVFQTTAKYPDDRYCLFTLGTCYEFGYGTEKNYAKAFECYKKSAKLGCPWGMHYLAYAYFSGQGVEKNLEEGFKWELLAAEVIPQAQFNVGISYLQGQGTQPNKEEAKKWLQRAAENFYEPANKILKEIDG